jgi:hypothetical protein
VADSVEPARARNYGRFMNFKEEIMTTKTRTIVALATLSLATAGYALDNQGSGQADAAAATSAGNAALLAGGSRVQDGVRITVKEFRTADAAQAEADRMLVKAYGGRRGAIVCDLHKQSLSVPGVPGARGVVVDHRTGTASSTKVATIVFSKGAFTFRLSAEGKPGALRLSLLKRESRREYSRLAA